MKRALLVAALAAVMMAGSAAQGAERIDYEFLPFRLATVTNYAVGGTVTHLGLNSEWEPYLRPIEVGTYNPFHVGVGTNVKWHEGTLYQLMDPDPELGYIQIDLLESFTINSLIALSHHEHGARWKGADSFAIMYWDVSTNRYEYVTVTDGPNLYYSGDDWIHPSYNNLPSDHQYRLGATSYEFEEVYTNSLRIVNVAAREGWIFSDFIVTNTKIPEPATMSLLALGGLALLRRRRK